MLDEEEGDHIVKALGNKKVRPRTLYYFTSMLILFQAVILQVCVAHSIPCQTGHPTYNLDDRITASSSPLTPSRGLSTSSSRSRNPARSSSWQTPRPRAPVGRPSRSGTRTPRSHTTLSAACRAVGSAACRISRPLKRRRGFRLISEASESEASEASEKITRCSLLYDCKASSFYCLPANADQSSEGSPNV